VEPLLQYPMVMTRLPEQAVVSQDDSMVHFELMFRDIPLQVGKSLTVTDTSPTALKELLSEAITGHAIRPTPGQPGDIMITMAHAHHRILLEREASRRQIMSYPAAFEDNYIDDAGNFFEHTVVFHDTVCDEWFDTAPLESIAAVEGVEKIATPIVNWPVKDKSPAELQQALVKAIEQYRLLNKTPPVASMPLPGETTVMPPEEMRQSLIAEIMHL
jgi:hypothetical protein